MPSCAAVLPERRLRMSADYIALVRRGPRSVSQTGLRDALAQAPTGQAPATLFFHGDGCETAHALVAGASALARSGRFDLCVCSTSWKRRYGQVPPPSPLRAESLVFFYQRLARARRVDSFGLGGCCCCPVPVVGRDALPLLIEIAAAPADERQHRETLEVALGAAALELTGGPVACCCMDAGANIWPASARAAGDRLPILNCWKSLRWMPAGGRRRMPGPWWWTPDGPVKCAPRQPFCCFRMG